MPDDQPNDAPELDVYLDEPLHPDIDGQDDTDDEVAARAFFATRVAPRDWAESLAWARGQSIRRDKDWTGKCQEFCRTAPGIGGGFSSALAQWHGLDDSDRHVGGDPADAPVGAMLFSQGRNPGASSFRFGHVLEVARPFKHGLSGGWSTDALRTGWPDKIHPATLYAKWDHHYLGYGLAMNGVDLRVKDQKPKPTPKPQTAKYTALEAAAARQGRAVDALKVALKTAQADKDAKDVERLHAAIVEVTHSQNRLLRLAEHLRHS